MPVIYIDNRKHEISAENKNLLEVCLSLGYNLPYFCWHPQLGSVGACRQCAVKKFKDEGDKQGRIVMACMEPVTDGMRISISDPEAQEFRASIISWLMINHPHDCPVCDEGGECHLQDMTVMTGHAYRSYRFKKQTFRNQDLGPFINHEMNRCIQCFRCVRYYRDYAGGKDLNAFASRDRTYFGRHTDGPLESEFSGNLVEICPTGVFTDKTLKQHYTRKWDLQNAPSVCVHCSLGCNIIAGERYGKLRRVVNRYHSKINGYFLCDRGRFGYDFVNSPERVTQPLFRSDKNDEYVTSDPDKIIREFRKAISESDKVIGIGSERASLESNYALRRLVGADQFYQGISQKQLQLTTKALDIMQHGSARIPSLSDCSRADVVLILGEDVTNTAPMLDLAVRQAVRQKALKKAEKSNLPLWSDAAVREFIQDDRGPLYISTPGQTKLDPIAAAVYRAAAFDSARLGMTIAHEISTDAPLPDGDLAADIHDLARRIAQDLQGADRPLIIAGVSSGEPAILDAVSNIALALKQKKQNADLCFTFPSNNSLGLAMIGGQDLDKAEQAIGSGRKDSVIILETDIYRHLDQQAADRFFEKCKRVIVLDSVRTQTVKKADIVLPATTFAESDGIVINNEGRAQRYFKIFPEKKEIRESRNWLKDISTTETDRENFDELVTKLTHDLPQFKGIETMKFPENEKIPRQSHRFSGRTSMNANIRVSESKPPTDPDSSLAFSMEGISFYNQTSYLPLVWAPGWNSAQAINKFQSEIAGPLRNGESGIRLITPLSKGEEFFRLKQNDREKTTDSFLVNPIYHIYGSEELSSYAAALSSRIPEPYLAMNPDNARRLKIADGSIIELKSGKTSIRLPVRIEASLPLGTVGYPVGLPGLPAFDIPFYAEITKVEG